jgi:hypothetical protein
MIPVTITGTPKDSIATDDSVKLTASAEDAESFKWTVTRDGKHFTVKGDTTSAVLKFTPGESGKFVATVAVETADDTGTASATFTVSDSFLLLFPLDEMERLRREREEELILLQLLLLDSIKKDAEAAPDPFALIEHAMLTEAVPEIAESMAAAHLDAFAIYASPAAAEAAKTASDALVRLYTPQATEAAQAMADAIRAAGSTDVREAIRLANMSPGSSSALALGAERNIVTASNAGLVSGGIDITIEKGRGVKRAPGLRHVSTIDSRTTPICFSGSTRVAPIGGLVRVYRRFYEGEMLVIRTAAGEKIEVTPNHPILTPSGWLPAKELYPGNEITYSVGSNGVCLECAKYVGVPPTFAELADSVFHPSVSHIQTKRSATANFHGDGMGRDHKIDIAVVNRHLMNNFVASGLKKVGDNLLGFLNAFFGIGLSSLGGGSQSSMGLSLAGMASQCTLPFSQRGEYPSSASAKLPFDFNRSNAGPVHFNRLDHVQGGLLASCSTGDEWHDANLSESSSDRRGGAMKLPCQRCGRLAVSIAPSKIIEMRKKDTFGHVYNLESSHGCYIANGLLVKNCRPRDGIQLPITAKYWLECWPSLHFRCRSILAPLLGDYDIVEPPPEIPPPAPGFGEAPAAFILEVAEWHRRSAA